MQANIVIIPLKTYVHCKFWKHTETTWENHKKQLLPTGETIILVEEGDKIHNDFQKFNPEKSLITNSIFWAILDIEGFHFSLGTFGEVEGDPDPLEPPDETYTQGKFDISGSNETMQNALASIV